MPETLKNLIDSLGVFLFNQMERQIAPYTKNKRPKFIKSMFKKTFKKDNYEYRTAADGTRYKMKKYS